MKQEKILHEQVTEVLYEYEYKTCRKTIDGVYEKRCPKCKEFKSANIFNYNLASLDGYQTYCKECQSTKRKAHHRKYPERSRQDHLKNSYNITFEQKQELIKLQNNCCYLCDNSLPDDPKQRHIEHDKITKKVYGVACRKCNNGIAFFNHDPYLMVKVAKRMLRLRR